MERLKTKLNKNTTHTVIELAEDTEYNTSLPSVLSYWLADNKTHFRKNNTETVSYVSW